MPSEANPLAEGLPDGETVDDLRGDSKRADSADDKQRRMMLLSGLSGPEQRFGLLTSADELAPVAAQNLVRSLP